MRHVDAETARQMWEQAKKEERQRAADMPTDQDAIDAMHRAWWRLNELGWQDALYCPKDGTVFEVIEAGSTGIHKCVYHGEWPDGGWWIIVDGDMSPSRPVLWRPISEDGDTR